MKRRIMMIVCAMMLVLGLAATSFAASATITGSTANAKVGDTVTVEFKADKGGYLSYKAAVSYDNTKLELVKMGPGTQNVAKGIVSGAYAEAQGAGTVFTATFKVLDGTYEEATQVPVSFEMKEFFGEGGAAIDVEAVAGAVVIAKNAEKPTEPTVPVEPTEPADPADPTEPADKEVVEEEPVEDSVKTGDESNMMVFGVIALAAAAVATGTVFTRRKSAK